jgi:hypothetical protein
MASLYPDIEPYDRGMLDVGDGHRVYWETWSIVAATDRFAAG